MADIKFRCPACDQKILGPEELDGEEVKCPTCGEEFEAAKTKRNSAEMDAERLEDMKSSGIKWVKVLGCGRPGEDCEACLSLKDKRISIQRSPNLPLPGCDLPECKCIIVTAS